MTLKILNQPKQRLIKLIHNCVKDYEWGSTQPNCYVSQLSKTEKKRWAELWMGTHPNGESQTENGRKLSQYLKSQNLGEIKFLFKVLSIQKCLSIQVHPSKTQAKELHLLKPQIYVDDNDKPQMFITLTDFQCLLGCIDHQQLVNLIQIPPFSSYSNKQIKPLLGEILSKDEVTIKQDIQTLMMNKQRFNKQRQILIYRLNQQFPGDVGILASCLLKYRKIKPGVCYYISPKTPHAYIYGECMELMKNSDNVVRLGLTNKLKDIKIMLDILQTKNQIHEVSKNQNIFKIQNLKICEINDSSTVQVTQISIGIVVQGSFQIHQRNFAKGDSFILLASEYQILGKGKMFIGSYQQ